MECRSTVPQNRHPRDLGPSVAAAGQPLGVSRPMLLGLDFPFEGVG